MKNACALSQMLDNYHYLVEKYRKEGNKNLVKYFEARVKEYELKLVVVETFS